MSMSRGGARRNTARCFFGGVSHLRLWLPSACSKFLEPVRVTGSLFCFRLNLACSCYIAGAEGVGCVKYPQVVAALSTHGID